MKTPRQKQLQIVEHRYKMRNKLRNRGASIDRVYRAGQAVAREEAKLTEMR